MKVRTKLFEVGSLNSLGKKSQKEMKLFQNTRKFYFKLTTGNYLKL